MKLPDDTPLLALCSPCFKNIELNTTLFCGECHARLPQNTKICHKSSPFLLGAASDYGNDVIRSSIHALKFTCVKDVARPLGEILAWYAKSIDISFATYDVIPIPLSKIRERHRGFNQSELIARVFATSFPEMHLETNILRRRRHTKPQSELKGRDERMKNMESAFYIPAPDRVRERNFILIDDVTTSGATLFEAARTLKQAGAKNIIGLVVAKA